MQSMSRQIRFKRLAIQLNLRRIPAEKDSDVEGSIVVTYTLLMEDPFYPETVMSQKRFTINLSDVPTNIRDTFVENIQLIESVIKKVWDVKGLSAIGVSYILTGIDDAQSGNFSIKSGEIRPQIKEGQTYSNSSFDLGDSEKIRAELAKLDTFFYHHTLDRVRDDNSRIGIKLDGL